MQRATPPTAAGDDTAQDPVSRVAAMLAGIGPVLGVDAGGTGTRAALVIDGVTTERYSAAPFNFLLYDDGVPRMAALARAARPAAMGIGVPGLAREPGAAAAFAAAVSEACGVRTRVAPDATTAWLGAFLGRPGIAVIAGTGSVAVGGSPGALLRAGGHGHLVGDEGSGYWIGRTALRAALAAAEGAGPPTRLGDALTEAAGASLDELVLRAQRSPGDRTVLAGSRPSWAGAPGSRTRTRWRALSSPKRRRLWPGWPPRCDGGSVSCRWPGSAECSRCRALWAAFQRATGAVPPLAQPEMGAALLAAGPAG